MTAEIRGDYVVDRQTNHSRRQRRESRIEYFGSEPDFEAWRKRETILSHKDGFSTIWGGEGGANHEYGLT